MPNAERRAEPRWGLGEFFAVWAAGYVLVTVTSPIILALTGVDAGTAQDDWPLRTTVLSQVVFDGTWLAGVLAVGVWRGRGAAEDFALRIRARDVPIGLLLGAAAQGAGNALYLPLYWFTSYTSDDVSGPANNLAEKASTFGGKLALFAVVAVLVPIVEELLFRGLLLRSLERRIGSWWAVIVTTSFFAITHFQGLQTPVLFLFGLLAGWLAVRTGRLGASICAHVAFNATALVFLLR